MSAAIHIGTSGWQYKHWIGTFYPEKLPQSQMLVEYVKHFNTVELNSSFYHQPPRTTFENWKKKTPPGFLFSVKASRYITHNKKLLDAEESLSYFLKAATGLGKKLGVILFQMPPSWQMNLDRLESFLTLLPNRLRFTFEFRHPSWMKDDVYALLRKYNTGFCIYELNRFETPHIVTADTIYIRLHGPDGKYRGNYSDESLRMWAAKIKRWSKKAKEIYVYFDNDIGGYAPKNALALKELLEKRKT